ncbi:MAG: hypothetical protein ACT4OJ_01295 [Bacteroidota bacterium]
MIAIDYLTDDNGDIAEDPVTLDFVEGASDDQHIEDIMRFEPGEMKYDVLMGVGIEKQINGVTNDGALRKLITLQLEADDYRVSELRIAGELIDINAERTN